MLKRGFFLCFFLAVMFLTGCLTAKPQAKASASYQVTVIGDIHFDGPEFHTGAPINEGRVKERKRNFGMWQGGASAKVLETAAKQADAAFAIQLGDICQGDADTPELQGKLLAGGFAAVKRHFPNIPLLVVKGNHDVRVFKTQNDPAPYQTSMLPLTAKEIGVLKLADGNYVYRHGPDVFIAADGFVGAKKLVAFVKKALAENADARHVFFLTHLPVLPVAGGNPLWRLPASDEIAALLEKRNAVILAAHTHTFSLIERRNANGRLVQLVTTSMGNTWRDGHVLEVARDWAQYMAALEKEFSKTPKGRKTLEQVRKIAAAGDYAGRIFKSKSGFTVLDIDERRIKARIYTDASGVPALKETLTVVVEPKQEK